MRFQQQWRRKKKHLASRATHRAHARITNSIPRARRGGGGAHRENYANIREGNTRARRASCSLVNFLKILRPQAPPPLHLSPRAVYILLSHQHQPTVPRCSRCTEKNKLARPRRITVLYFTSSSDDSLRLAQFFIIHRAFTASTAVGSIIVIIRRGVLAVKAVRCAHIIQSRAADGE